MYCDAVWCRCSGVHFVVVDVAVAVVVAAAVPARSARGGNGSFKDRKPIGEVDCCESWMADQSH